MEQKHIDINKKELDFRIPIVVFKRKGAKNTLRLNYGYNVNDWKVETNGNQHHLFFKVSEKADAKWYHSSEFVDSNEEVLEYSKLYFKAIEAQGHFIEDQRIKMTQSESAPKHNMVFRKEHGQLKLESISLQVSENIGENQINLLKKINDRIDRLEKLLEKPEEGEEENGEEFYSSGSMSALNFESKEDQNYKLIKELKLRIEHLERNTNVTNPDGSWAGKVFPDDYHMPEGTKVRFVNTSEMWEDFNEEGLITYYYPKKENLNLVVTEGGENFFLNNNELFAINDSDHPFSKNFQKSNF